MVWYLLLFKLISMIISLFLLVNFTYKSIDKNIKFDFKTISTIIIFGIIISFNGQISSNSLILLGNYILEILLFWFLDKTNLRQKIYSFSLIMIYGIFIEFIVLITFSKILNISNLNDFTTIQQLISLIISYFVWFGSWNYFLKINKFKKMLEKFKTKLNMVLKLEWLFVLLLMIINIVYIKCYSSFDSYLYGILIILVINFIFAILILNIKINYEKELLEKKSNYLNDNIKIYEKVAEEYKLIKHNLISDLLIAKSLCTKEGQDIINAKIVSYNKDYEWINAITDVPEGIQGLIYLKIEEAKKHNVKIVVDSGKKNNFCIKKSKKYLELCETLEIVLNNAIEAAENAKDKIVKIEIVLKNNLELKIYNIFDNNIDLEKIGRRNYSTKNRNSGLGLFYLKKVQSLKITNKIINNVYITNIMTNI